MASNTRPGAAEVQAPAEQTAAGGLRPHVGPEHAGSSRAAHGLPLAVLCLAALLAMYPLIPQPGSRILGWPGGDNVQYTYMTGWFARALLEGRSPFQDPLLNYPDQLALASTDAPFLAMLLVAPATLLGGPALGYNLIMVVSHLLSGLFAYFWVTRLTGSRSGGLIAGLAFMLTPYRLVHSYGHLQLVATPGLVLFFWALDRALAARPGLRDLALLCGAVFVVGVSAQYYLIICLLSGAVYTLLTWLRQPAYLLRYGWRLLLAVVPGSLLSALPYLSATRSNSYQPYSIESTRVWSAALLDFIVPSRLHPLWGALVEQLYPRQTWIEHTLYIGGLTAVLALVALVWPGSQQRRRTRIWLGVVLVALVCALGTDLRLSGEPLQPEQPFWLPMYYLGQLPVIELMRVWSRFSVVLLLFLALLAGIGAARLLQAAGARSRLLAGLLLLLLVLDLLPGRLQSTLLVPRPVDHWLAAQPGDFAVAFLPPGYHNYTNQFGRLLHDKALPATNHPVHLPAAYQRFAQSAKDFPQPHSIAALRAIGLRYLVLAPLLVAHQLPDGSRIGDLVRQSPELSIVAEVDGFLVVGFR